MTGNQLGAVHAAKSYTMRRKNTNLEYIVTCQRGGVSDTTDTPAWQTFMDIVTAVPQYNIILEHGNQLSEFNNYMAEFIFLSALKHYHTE